MNTSETKPDLMENMNKDRILNAVPAIPLK
jgi:hypothetical protein